MYAYRRASSLDVLGGWLPLTLPLYLGGGNIKTSQSCKLLMHLNFFMVLSKQSIKRQYTTNYAFCQLSQDLIK
jgi:hypothetical protein